MMTRNSVSRERSESGQTIVLVAFLMVFLIGVLGLVVDVGAAYANQRFYRSVADSSSLAGAQELQTPNRRTLPTAADYESARGLAMRSLVNQLADDADPLPACAGSGPPYPSDITNCQIPGTPYFVSTLAPAPTCATGGCDPIRSVQVTVRRPDVGLVFARVFNQFQWNVTATSIAELGYSANYTLVTLRPPKPSRRSDPSCAPNCDANEGNITLSGTTTRLFIEGDIGTNTNITLTADAQIVLDPIYSAYHFDAYVNWTAPPNPKQLNSPLPDPGYPIPGRGTVTPYTTDTAARITDDALCDAERDKAMAASSGYGIGSYTSAGGELLCYKPGIYSFKVTPSAAARAILLTPGLYFFDRGLDAGSNVRLIGGYEANSQGVALVFPSGASCSPPCSFDVENSPLVALNAGSAIPTIGSGTATAAFDYDGNPVDNGGSPPVLMTLIVEKDSRCTVGLTEPADCPTLNQLKLPGGGSLFLTGIQYAPSDQSTILGGSAGSGYIGQFISWTVKYTGGSQVRLTHAGEEGPGVLRLATPCSPFTSCDNDYAAARLP